MKYPKLFSAINIRGCAFPNRIMLTAAVTRLAEEDGHVTDAIIQRYQRIAKGGLGAMVVEAAVVLPSRSSFNLRVSDDEFIDDLKRMVDEIRLVNPELKIGLQIMHFLKVARSGWRQRVENLSLEEVKGTPELFANGALRTKKAGFDFVEVHMAHFTTLSSFLSLVNKREDEYGGDFESRLKLPTEVLIDVRDAVGEAYPVGVRINGEEFTKEGNTVLHSSRIARRFAGLDVDFISLSAGERFEDAEPTPEGFPPFPGTGYSGARMSPRWWSPDATQVHLAEEIRKSVREAGYDVPIVTAGKIRTPGMAEEILEQGKADIVGMARTLFSDPDWPQKARDGKADDIVVCAACGYCSESDERYEKVYCIQWPKGMLNPPSPWLLLPPCSVRCPAEINIRGYIDLIAQGKLKDALCLIKEKCPFPGVVSKVCPRFCEKGCNRAEFDDPIAINSLKRYVVDRVGLDKEEIIPIPRTKNERVAIVGSGPAGLSAGYYLARKGYGVTVFEALPVAGGMMSVGIQDSRLPKDLVMMEVENIRRIGVEIKLNHSIGKNGQSLDDLRDQGYQAIFLATGTQRKRKLKLPGGGKLPVSIENLPDLSFLDQKGFSVTEKSLLEVTPNGLQTGVDGVFAGGDMVNGPTSVIQAVSSGRKAAMAIDRYLRGKDVDEEKAEPMAIPFEDLDTTYFKKRTRQELPEKDGYSGQAAESEADRCFQCGMFPKKIANKATPEV